jgi:transposase
VWGWFADGGVMSRAAALTDAQWLLIEPLMPSSDGKQGNQFRDHRQVVEGIIYRFRSGLAWRDLPGEFGPWQAVWKRHRRFSADGTWDRIHTALLTHADAIGEIDWNVSIDWTVNRAHQHGTTLSRELDTAGDTGAWSNHRNFREEPPDHAIGRSRGGLSTKIHHAGDGKVTAEVARWCC